MNPKPDSPEIAAKWDRLSLHEKKYLGLMGMAEMERAVEYLESKAAGGSLENVLITPTDFRGVGDGVSVGLMWLLWRGWLEPASPVNDTQFVPSRGLLAKLNQRWGTNYERPKLPYEGSK